MPRWGMAGCKGVLNSVPADWVPTAITAQEVLAATCHVLTQGADPGGKGKGGGGGGWRPPKPHGAPGV